MSDALQLGLILSGVAGGLWITFGRGFVSTHRCKQCVATSLRLTHSGEKGEKGKKGWRARLTIALEGEQFDCVLTSVKQDGMIVWQSFADRPWVSARLPLSPRKKHITLCAIGSDMFDRAELDLVPLVPSHSPVLDEHTFCTCGRSFLPLTDPNAPSKPETF